MVVLFSCNKQTDKQDDIFINDDFKNIIEKIIANDDMSQNLTIYLEDGKINTEIWIFGFGLFEDCTNVKGVFEYQNRTLIFIDNSNRTSFDDLISFSKISTKLDCELFVKSLDESRRKDYKSFSYLYKQNKLYYLNNSPVEYKNDTVVLDKFIIDTIH